MPYEIQGLKLSEKHVERLRTEIAGILSLAVPSKPTCPSYSTTAAFPASSSLISGPSLILSHDSYSNTSEVNHFYS